MTEQPGPDVIEMARPPKGYRAVWVEDTDARLMPPGEQRICRRPGCQNEATWQLHRANGWWSYCAIHNYGKRFRSRIVQKRIIEKKEDD